MIGGGSILKTYKGIVASEGIAIGSVYLYEEEDILRKVPVDCKITNIQDEALRLKNALTKYKEHLNSLKQLLPPAENTLLNAYEQMAEALVNEALELMNSTKICAELSIKKIYEKYSEMFRESGSGLIALRESDLRNIASTLIKFLIGLFEEERIDVHEQIIIADEISPANIIKFVGQKIKGIVTRKGGVTSHVAIIARNNGIPYLIVPLLDFDVFRSETKSVIVDSLEGILIVEPDNSIIETYVGKLENYNKLREEVQRYARVEAYTQDLHKIEVLCNAGNLEEARIASDYGCDGIGLFRTEFLYTSERPPSQDLLEDIFNKLLGFFKDKPIVIRAPDLGADKPLPYIKLEEQNPFLGLRGIRLLLEYREEIFRPFLRAYISIARNASNLKLLLPMVSKVSEIYDTINIIDDVGNELGISNAIELTNLGIMVETPAAAIEIDKFLETNYIKFISIGTNDLTQYVLAVDRMNARLSKLYNELDPAVLRIMKFAIENAKRYNVRVDVCGELASRTYAVPILIGLNVDELSINPHLVGLTKYIISKSNKTYIRKEILDEILNINTDEKILKAAKDYLKSLGVSIL